jgi:hypothetical protein
MMAALKPFGPEWQKRRDSKGSTGLECCLCGKVISDASRAFYVPIDMATGRFVATDKTGPDISLYPLGGTCINRYHWATEF